MNDGLVRLPRGLVLTTQAMETMLSMYIKQSLDKLGMDDADLIYLAVVPQIRNDVPVPSGWVVTYTVRMGVDFCSLSLALSTVFEDDEGVPFQAMPVKTLTDSLHELQAFWLDRSSSGPVPTTANKVYLQ